MAEKQRENVRKKKKLYNPKQAQLVTLLSGQCADFSWFLFPIYFLRQKKHYKKQLAAKMRPRGQTIFS